MAEKVDNPLRDIYRQLGIPLAGEGDYADVKPGPQPPAWPGPFDKIREAFDPEYAQGKKLVQTQQGMMQDFIQAAQAYKSYQATQTPTVGEAQALFPGFPAPPQAFKTTPQDPLQSMEMPVHQGTQQVQISDNRTQGPMPGILTPLGRESVDLMNARQPGEPSLLSDSMAKDFMERGPGFYQEAPRPLRTIDIGQYGPDSAPSQSTVMDPTTRLPLSFQSQLGALQHQASQRQIQPHYPSADEIKYKQAVELGTMAWMEQHPGQQPKAQDLFQIQQQAAGGFEKAPLPGTNKARIEGAQAIKEEAAASVAPKKEQLGLEHTQAQTDDLRAKTAETNKLMDAKLQELLSRVELHKAQGNVLAGKAELAEFREKLGIDNLKWKVIHTLINMDELDQESKLVGIKSLIENDPNLQVRAQDPSWIGSLLGQTSGSGIKIEPRQGGGVQAPKIPSTNVPAQPLTPAPAPPEDDAGALRALGLSMKDGDVKDYKGQKYRRKGGKLEKVK